MRLFGKVDGAVDRYDRAGWLTIPFDLSLQAVVPVQGTSQLCIEAIRVYPALVADEVRVFATLDAEPVVYPAVVAEDLNSYEAVGADATVYPAVVGKVTVGCTCN